MQGLGFGSGAAQVLVIRCLGEGAKLLSFGEAEPLFKGWELGAKPLRCLVEASQDCESEATVQGLRFGSEAAQVVGLRLEAVQRIGCLAWQDTVGPRKALLLVGPREARLRCIRSVNCGPCGPRKAVFDSACATSVGSCT